jgi:ABC-type glutathione transport system ATPase component
MSASGPVLSVTGLTVVHGKGNSSRTVVRNVGFEVPPGSVLGIIGESGAGKTSLGLALMGLHDAGRVEISGDVIFQGKNLLDLDESELCRIRGAGIGMILQDATGALDPAMRVVDQVAEAIRLHQKSSRAEARRMARQQLAEVGVTEYILTAAPYAHQLSGGLCQRAMIAAAFACGPELLIADEPTSSLDVTLQAQIIGLLNARRLATGLAIVFISHDLALVSSFADEIVVLREGEAVEQGSCARVLAKPQHEYTAGLIAAWNYRNFQGGGAVASA